MAGSAAGSLAVTLADCRSPWGVGVVDLAAGIGSIACWTLLRGGRPALTEPNTSGRSRA